MKTRDLVLAGALSAALLSGCSIGDAAVFFSDSGVTEVNTNASVAPSAQQITFADKTTMKVAADTSVKISDNGVTYPMEVKGDDGHFKASKDSVLIPVSWSGSFRHRPKIELVFDDRSVELSSKGPSVVVPVPTGDIGKPHLRVSLGSQSFTLDLAGRIAGS